MTTDKETTLQEDARNDAQIAVVQLTMDIMKMAAEVASVHSRLSEVEMEYTTAEQRIYEYRLARQPVSQGAGERYMRAVVERMVLLGNLEEFQRTLCSLRNQRALEVVASWDPSTPVVDSGPLRTGRSWGIATYSMSVPSPVETEPTEPTDAERAADAVWPKPNP